MSEPLKILVTGCRGRMGEAVARCAGLDAEVTVSGKIDAGDDLQAALEGCDAVVDFSHHTFTRDLVTACRDQGKLLVIGTTGLSAETEAFIRETSQSPADRLCSELLRGREHPVLADPQGRGDSRDRTSTWKWWRCTTTKRSIPPAAPRGRLAEILCDVEDLSYDQDVRHGRFGNVGARTKREVGMHAVRGGDVVGDHTVIFAAPGRTGGTDPQGQQPRYLRPGRHARRQVAAPVKKPGLYDMQDVLGLR